MTYYLGITDGSAGMVAQVEALVEAMHIPVHMETIAIKKPWVFLPNAFYDVLPKSFALSCVVNGEELVEREIPEIVISCGRKAALVAAALKSENPQIKTIHIQDPQMSAENFDVVVAMEHDKITGDNVIKTRFALHSITKEKLSKAKETFAPVFSKFPAPRVAVLIGGSTNKYELTKARMQKLIAEFKSIKGSLLITPSRRTGVENISDIMKAFSDSPHVYIYDGEGDNPYLGLLALADEIYVTNDSVNMMTEAFATGKKVTILELEGHEDTKPANFAKMIAKNPMQGDEMQKLAAEVKRLLVA